MHVALGVGNDKFPIAPFLQADRRKSITIQTVGETGRYGATSLNFSSNPARRGGEWLIRDQFSHRHPAWSSTNGFPDRFSRADPPYVLIFRVGRYFHARFANAGRLARLPKGAAPQAMLSDQKGIALVSPALLAAFHVPTRTTLDAIEEQAREQAPELFAPKDVLDGRRRVFAEVLQRLGQQAFRRKLLAAYKEQCAITRTDTKWVLEAAHITPYRGVKTNAVSNGLLLRADVHTLFDLNLISIEPEHLRVRVSSTLSGSLYEKLDGRAPMIPVKAAERPSEAALRDNYSLFQP